mgnify:CR=1 FL=1
MTDLTEQWKKGDLPCGWYYVKDIHNKESLDRYFKETDNFEYLEDWEVGEVLAPVPSYEQWQAKLEENAKLKELLKECREFYQKMYSLNIINSCSLPLYDDLKKRINQALGEDK